MPHLTPKFEQIRDDQLRDIRNQRPDADITPDSDYHVRASAVASAIDGLYRDQRWIVRQIFADTADSDNLELHARTRGLRRKVATTATGNVTLTGEPGTPVNAGLEIRRDSLAWVTTEEGTLPENGQLTVRASSSAAGTSGNMTSALGATLVSAPYGIDSAVMVGVMAGGTEIETDAALLARYLELIRRPPAGGNQYDYRRWALEVDGVTGAFVYPLRRGLGTVDIAITSADGLPSAEIIAATQQYIDNVRPVTASNTVIFAPTIKTVNFEFEMTLSGIGFDDATSQVNAIVTTAVNRLQPGESLIRSQISALILTIPGVTDIDMIAPSRNVNAVISAAALEWIRMGTIDTGDNNE